ncbi:MAG: hypothetical protein RMA76_26660 [Deltaproteobacteria bacterium]|jgi:hypothetical protein
MTTAIHDQLLVSSATKPPPPLADHPLGVVDQLLRSSGTFLDQIEQTDDLTRIAKTLIVTIILSSAAFGAAIGASRMGLQPLYAALKLPLVVLLTAGLTVPAFSALTKASVGVSSLRRDLLLVLSSLALTSMVLAALAPVVLLGVMVDVRYHALILLVVGCCGVGGLAGLVFFLRGVSRRSTKVPKLATLIALSVFALVGSQMSWTLRPFVSRPRAEVELVRSIEGSFLDAVATSMRSARGIYTRDSAPLPEDSQ